MPANPCLPIGNTTITDCQHGLYSRKLYCRTIFSISTTFSHHSTGSAYLVFRNGPTRWMPVCSRTKMTASKARTTLINLDRRTRTPDPSKPSMDINCCCCCCNSILVIYTTTRHKLLHTADNNNMRLYAYYTPT